MKKTNNIFDSQNFKRQSIKNCKIAFLSKQTQWIKREYQFLYLLISKCKQIINASLDSYPNVSKNCQEKIHLFNNLIKNHLQLKESIPSKFTILQTQLDVEDFNNIIQSSKQMIQTIHSELKKIKDKNQQLDQLKDGFNQLKQHDSIITLRSIDFLDLDVKFIKKYKKRYQQLKNLKTAVEQLLKNPQRVYQGQFQSGQSQTKDTLEHQQLITLQKSIVLLKQKQLNNYIKQSNISKLKKQIQYKKNCIKKLQIANDNTIFANQTIVNHYINNDCNFNLQLSAFEHQCQKKFDDDQEFSVIQTPKFKHQGFYVPSQDNILLDLDEDN